MKNIPNQDTLGAALELVRQGLAEASRFPLKSVDEFQEFWSFCGGINYGTHKTKSFELETGRPKAQRFLHVTITRLDSGRYETVAYIN